MKFAISNLGWNKKENENILKKLGKEKILLEYSLSKIFHDTNCKNIIKLKKKLKKFNVKSYSMQSLLYKSENTFLFGNSLQKKNLLNEIEKKFEQAKYLNSKVMIFGSPHVKKSFGKNKKTLDIEFLKILKKISKIAKKYKVYFLLEANPKIYGSEFLSHSEDTFKFIKKLKSKYIKANLDLGTVIANKENYKKIFIKNKKSIKHIQVSNPSLKKIDINSKYVKDFISFLKKKKYKNILSFEQLYQKENLNNIFDIIKRVNQK